MSNLSLPLEGVAERSEFKIPMLAGGKHTIIHKVAEHARSDKVENLIIFPQLFYRNLLTPHPPLRGTFSSRRRLFLAITGKFETVLHYPFYHYRYIYIIDYI